MVPNLEWFYSLLEINLGTNDPVLTSPLQDAKPRALLMCGSASPLAICTLKMGGDLGWG